MTEHVSNRSKRKTLLLLLLILVFLLGALGLFLFNLRFPSFFTSRIAQRSTRPMVLIHNPSHGDKIAVGEPLLVHASAYDANNITRLEIWVDGQLIKVQTSNIAGGVSPLSMATTWRASEAGQHTLTARAFNTQHARTSASVQVECIVEPDQDDDGIPDAEDACPDVSAPRSGDGCPTPDDRDGDGVANSDDDCPDEAGAAVDGCPTPGDRDGDSVPDTEDACPDVPGDEDVEGCPDRDGDSVPDAEDAAPDEPGPADLDGAPDRDEDGVPDVHDLSPEEPGPAEAGGAPEGPDRDEDGAPDAVDPCPDEAGVPEDDFCPPPADDPVPEDAGSGLVPFPGPSLGEFNPPLPVEVEAYYFQVNNDMDQVWCYIQLSDYPAERYDFAPIDGRHWNIQEHLGGDHAVSLTVPFRDESLPVYLECWGMAGDSLTYLGFYHHDHPATEWNGQELIASGSGDGGAGFIGKYRICSPTCEETEMPAPVAQHITLGPYGEGPYKIHWAWDGDEDQIDGFVLDVNGAIYGPAGAVLDPGARTMDITDFKPFCGETNVYGVRAFRGSPGPAERVLSRSSNRLAWQNLRCPRTVAVTFESIQPSTHTCDPYCGPMQGTFFVNDTALIPEYHTRPPTFDSTHPFHYQEYDLFPGRTKNIADLFRFIETEAASCLGSGCPPIYAPSTNTITVDLGPHESLNIGARLWALRAGSEYDYYDRSPIKFFEDSIRIPYDELRPGEYILNDHGIHLRVRVDVLVGPEAGGPEHLPDLTITDVTTEEDSDQLRVHVRNNAAPLSHQDITIRYTDLETGETIDTITWADVSMAPGDEKILQTSHHIDPYGLHVELDPDNVIPETDEENNSFDTPIRMHVQFLRLQWGDPCESFLSPGLIAEYNFRIGVGHRSPDGETTWIARRRYPWAGNITVDWTDWTTEDDWVLEDDEAFDFEFNMPVDHELVIWADGYEDDIGLAADDYAGQVYQSYGADINYGDSDEDYHYASTDWHECHDGTPLGWNTNNFHIWWRIHRVH